MSKAFDIIHVSELRDEVEEMCRTTRLDKKTNEFVLLYRLNNEPPERSYRIDLDEVKTHKDILGWVDHLCDKSWITTYHLQSFIGTASGKIK